MNSEQLPYGMHIEVIDPSQRTCPGCGERHSNNRAYCTECSNFSNMVYRLENPEKCAAWVQARRARKVEATVSPDADDEFARLREVAIEMEGIFGFPFEVDHIEPLILGGDHAPWNFQVISKSDNLRKHTRVDFKDYHHPRFIHPLARDKHGAGTFLSESCYWDYEEDA